MSEKRPVLGRFLAYACVEVSDNADYYDAIRTAGRNSNNNNCVTYYDERCLSTDNAIWAVDDSVSAALECVAMRTGPIHVHDKAEVHQRSASL